MISYRRITRLDVLAAQDNYGTLLGILTTLFANQLAFF